MSAWISSLVEIDTLSLPSGRIKGADESIGALVFC